MIIIQHDLFFSTAVCAQENRKRRGAPFEWRHSSRLAAHSREIARRAGYSEKDQNEIYMMGLLHDVGKIGVPDAGINKPGKLTDEEFEPIKNHPVMGARILKRRC